MPAGLERLASEFAQELSSAAGHAGDIGDGALGDLRDILSDTLSRIRDEVFAGGTGGDHEASDDTADDHGTGQHGTGQHATDERQAEGTVSDDQSADDQAAGEDDRPTA
jgi:hypothetical protein